MPSPLVAGLPNAPYDKSSPQSYRPGSRKRTHGRPSLDRQNSSRRTRRRTIGENSINGRDDNDVESSKIIGKSSMDLGPRLTLRTRPSWMKRLSTMSSVDSNSSSNSRPGSPVVSNSMPMLSNSNDSPSSYVQRGPMAALADAQPSSRLPPNKLVKRASSQHLSNESSPSSRFSSLRRPITSHGRSAQLRHSASKTGSPFAESSPRPPENRVDEKAAFQQDTNGVVNGINRESNGRWRQFFSVKVSNPSTLSKKAGRDAKNMKRIVPEDGCFPTLITTKSILASSMDVDERYDPDDDSLFFGSRPGSAYLDAIPFLASEEKPIPVKRPSRANLDQRTSTERPSRRSFSLHELLSLGPSSQKQTPTPPPRNIGRRLSRKAARRVFSEPLATLGIGRTSIDVERPAKRRDITDPTIFQKSTSSQPPLNHRRAAPPSAGGSGVPSSPFTFSSETRSQNSRSENRSPSIPQHSTVLGTLKLDGLSHSPILTQSNMRASEHSAAPSERASTLVGSDSEMRGTNTIEEDDTDYGGETVFDSVRTRTTRSASGARDYRIETIFDESPPARKAGGFLTQHSIPLTKTLPDADTYFHQQEDIIEEEEGLATPVRTIRSDRADDGSPVARRMLGKRSRSPLAARLSIPSSPPELSKPLNLGKLEYDDELPEEDEESRWSCLDEEDEELDDAATPDDWIVEQVATPMALTRPSPFLIAAGTPTSATMPDLTLGTARDSKRDTITSLFDWSEHPPDKSPGNRTPPRPRTVHGKKDTDRGSRSVGRRAPSALHVRSQSVPVVPNVADKREVIVTNKFGTWGVGSKGVSEDWDDDFDFGDANAVMDKDDREAKRIDSGMAMRIPQTIRERQVNVVNNIGLVREFGLHVEELKTVRARAMSLGLFEEGGPLHHILDEIDGVIELADQDTEEFTVPRRASPTSSPNFDHTAFNNIAERPPTSEKRGRSRRCVSADISEPKVTPIVPRNRRRTLLTSDNGILSSPASQASSQLITTSTTTPTNIIGHRPRKDSEAIARSVIEALKKGKSSKEKSLALKPVPTNQRIHFDTTTLSRIVPLVNGLVRQVKEQIRKVEKLDLSPTSSPDPTASPTDPPLTNIFRNPGRQRATSTPRLSGEGFRPIDEMTEQMKVMTVM